MKRISIISFFVVSTFLSKNIHAQVSVSATINIGSQPAWGPTGYDHVDYYYLPDIDMYYYVPAQQYYYRSGDVWRASRALPPSFRNFDFYKAHKVVINNVNKPYLNNNAYKNKYGNFKGRQDQLAIRDSREEKYFENENHPQHQQWEQGHQQKNGNNSVGRSNEKNKKENRSNSDRRN